MLNVTSKVRARDFFRQISSVQKNYSGIKTAPEKELRKQRVKSRDMRLKTNEICDRDKCFLNE